MNRTFALLALLGIALAACAPVGTPQGGATPPGAPTSQPSPKAALPSATPTLPGETPQGGAGVVSAPDCARYPGFGACPTPLALSGRLAFYDEAHKRIDVLDLGLRLAWQAPAPAGTRRLAWLANGDFLIAYGADGKPALAWSFPPSSRSPDLSLSPQGGPVFTSGDGSAWLEQKEAQYLFHVGLGNEAEKTWPAEPQSSDKLHELLGWVKGAPLLLGGYHYAANSMWVTGNRLYTLDARTGVVQELDAGLRLGGSVGWHPIQAGLLAFGDSLRSPDMGAARLAVVDALTGKVTLLLADEAVSSSYPAWTPDGKAILHAASKVGEAPKAGDPFALAAIYLTPRPQGATTRLTSPPPGWRDAWPQPLANGRQFLFVRYHAETKQAELRLGALDGKSEALLASGLNVAAALQPTGGRWEAVLAYSP